MIAEARAPALLHDAPRLAAIGGVVATVNGVATTLLDAVAQQGVWEAIFTLAGVSAGIWFALFAILSIARDDRIAEPGRPGDLAVVAAMLGASLVPIVLAGSVAVFAGGLWFALTGPSGSRVRRIGIILLALSSTLLWGRLMLMLLGDTLLSLDGQFVAMLAGTSAEGNLVRFADARGTFVVGAPCSSLHNMTFAILLWASVTQLLDLRVSARVVAVGIAAMAGNLLVNGVRLALIALYPQHYETLHNGDGALLFGWAALIVAGVVVGVGLHVAARRSA